MVYMLHGMNNAVIVNALLSDLCISAMRVLGSCWKQRTRFGHGYYWLILATIGINHKFVHAEVRMAVWSKAPDSSSGPLTRAWVQIPLLTVDIRNFSYFCCMFLKNHYVYIEVKIFSQKRKPILCENIQVSPLSYSNWHVIWELKTRSPHFVVVQLGQVKLGIRISPSSHL